LLLQNEKNWQKKRCYKHMKKKIFFENCQKILERVGVSWEDKNGDSHPMTEKPLTVELEFAHKKSITTYEFIPLSLIL
jgi:hypothetical protein